MEKQLIKQEKNLLLTLKKLQFNDDEIDMFINYSRLKKMTLLKNQRKKLLEKAHEYYQLIDLIDYIINDYKGGKENG